MGNIALRAVRRVLVAFAAVAVPTYYISASPHLTLFQNGLDIMAFTFAVGSFVLNWNRTWLVLTTERIRTSHIHTASWQGMMIALMMSSVLAIHWRASGHVASISDGGVRVVFRWIYDLSTFGFLLTAGDYQPDVSYDGFRRVIGWLILIAFALGLLAYLDQPERHGCWSACGQLWMVEPGMTR